jgi:glutamate-1-semialdehyde aminotransferase
MHPSPVSFKRGMKILADNVYSPLSDLGIDEKRYALFPVMKRGKGPYLYDVDENRYVDFDLQQGALVHGHAHARLTSVMKAWLSRGYSGGVSSGVHRFLSSILHQALYGDASRLELKLVYVDSTCEALCMLPRILHGNGKRIVYLCSREVLARAVPIPCPYHNLKTLPYGEAANPGTDGFDYAVFGFDESVDGQVMKNTLALLRKNETTCIGDASTIASYIHMINTVDHATQLDAVVYGSWLSAGVPFGAVAVHNKTLLQPGGDTESEGGSEYSAATTVAVYKLRAAQRSLQMLIKSGGFTQLLKKHAQFHALLNKRYFCLSSGMVFMNNRVCRSSSYQDLRLKLFDAGFIFPRRHGTPVALSFAHTHELLRKSALKINRVFQHFYA